MKDLFDKVRVQGRIEIANAPSIRDVLPVIYREEANGTTNAVVYYNSGGRSLIFERAGQTYRVKGVDPFGKLTERVVKSGKNCMQDVVTAYDISRWQVTPSIVGECLTFDTKSKPFGPFLLEQAISESKTFGRLATTYERLGIENPCESLSYKMTGIEYAEKPTFQTAFKLPRVEADFRVHEFAILLAKRLDACSPAEIAQKSKNIARLYGRIIHWAGFNVALLSANGLLPTENSFHAQNWVLSRHKDGYGVFRVDHTSTRRVSSEEAFENLMTEQYGISHTIHDFSVFPSTVMIASNPKEFLGEQFNGQSFSSILNMRSSIPVNEAALLTAHKNVFDLGLAVFLQGRQIESIPESMFREALS